MCCRQGKRAREQTERCYTAKSAIGYSYRRTTCTTSRALSVFPKPLPPKKFTHKYKFKSATSQWGPAGRRWWQCGTICVPSKRSPVWFQLERHACCLGTGSGSPACIHPISGDQMRAAMRGWRLDQIAGRPAGRPAERYLSDSLSW